MPLVLKHVYIKEGEEKPEELSLANVFHIAERKEGIGLDIWWWEIEFD